MNIYNNGNYNITFNVSNISAPALSLDGLGAVSAQAVVYRSNTYGQNISGQTMNNTVSNFSSSIALSSVTTTNTNIVGTTTVGQGLDVGSISAPVFRIVNGTSSSEVLSAGGVSVDFMQAAYTCQNAGNSVFNCSNVCP